MTYAKWRPYCFGFNVLISCFFNLWSHEYFSLCRWASSLARVWERTNRVSPPLWKLCCVKAREPLGFMAAREASGPRRIIPSNQTLMKRQRRNLNTNWVSGRNLSWWEDFLIQIWSFWCRVYITLYIYSRRRYHKWTGVWMSESKN